MEDKKFKLFGFSGTSTWLVILFLVLMIGGFFYWQTEEVGEEVGDDGVVVGEE